MPLPDAFFNFRTGSQAMTQSQLQIANRLAQVKPSPMMEVNMAAQRLRAEGVDVLNLGMGEPGFDTPAHIIDAAFDAARAGDTHYTPTRGTAALCEAVVEKLKTENGLEYTPDQVVISNGAKQVLFQAMGATLNAGDEVILPAPFWSSYRDMVLVHGGVPVIVPCRPEDDFQITPEALEAAITPRTRWLFVNSPSNPAGGSWTRPGCTVLARCWRGRVG
jgi:aspartate aminotransferase